MNILAGAPGGGHTGGEDGWQAVPSRPARGTFEKVTLLATNCAGVKPVTKIFSSPSKDQFNFQVDTSRIKSLTTGKVDADSMSFGPPKAGGPSWGRGSQTKGPSRTEVGEICDKF